ncbi:MAG TPA: L,D-transpeptidase family protein, partial [Rhodospirillaceae bacterium]|nr:L,D-transpeptidase family protein [Rhodospirillaceae bacterium]
MAQAAVPLASSTDLIAGEIQQRLGEGGSEIRVRNETLDAEPLRRFYQRRGWHSAWSEMTEALLAVLAGAEADGLPVSSFHLNTLKSLLQTNSAAGLAERDLLLTDGLLRYAMAMRGQRIDPAEIEEDWFLTVPAFDAVEFLNENAKKLPTALLELRPLYAGYQLLSQKLVELKAVAAAGDWPKVPPGPPIKPGALDDRILDVRKRLAAAGLDAAPLGEPNFYDEALQSEVQLFQRRHGLNDDGVLGRQTVQTMNISAAERARQVAVNMERWRWLPARLEPNHIVVNVPGAWLEVVEGGKAVLSMRVIVGDPEHPTPALHAKMTSLVMNPIWRIPSSIAT